MTLYTLPTCGKCRMIKSKLEKKGIPFKMCDDVKILETKNFRGVPVLELEDGTNFEYYDEKILLRYNCRVGCCLSGIV